MSRSIILGLFLSSFVLYNSVYGNTHGHNSIPDSQGHVKSLEVPPPPQTTVPSTQPTTSNNTTPSPTTAPTTKPSTTTTPPTTPTTPPTSPTTPPTSPTTPSTSSSTTTPKPSTTTPTTPSPTPTSPTTHAPTTPHPNPPPPPSDRKFDAFSFLGGFALGIGLVAIGILSWKFYLSRQENYYHTL